MDALNPLVFLAIEINIDPTIGSLGPFTITWPGFLIAVGIILGVVGGIWLARRDGLPVEMGQELALVGVPSGIVGARLFYVIEHWGDYWPGNMNDAVFGITDGGITLYGGLIGGVAGGVVYAVIRRWPVGIALDAAAPAMILGHTIGRVGDLISGERAGTATDVSWAVRYTHPDTLGDLGIAVHPAAGSYEVLGGIAIFAVVAFVLRPRVKVAGWVFCGYVLMYAALRFVLSYFRADEATVGDVNITQITSAVVAGAAILAAGVLYRKPGPLTEEWLSRVHGIEPEPVQEQPRARRRGART